MERQRPCLVLLIVLALASSLSSQTEQQGSSSRAEQVPAESLPEARTPHPLARHGQAVRLTVRPAMLAWQIDELAGQQVRIVNARLVGVFEPTAFLIESATRIPTLLGHRDRVLVLVEKGSLRVPAAVAVASTVTVLGVARTLLGAKVTADVPWPTKLDDALIERLEVRAAVLASSVETPEGIELTGSHLLTREPASQSKRVPDHSPRQVGRIPRFDR
jgi:hypothetical protein